MAHPCRPLALCALLLGVGVSGGCGATSTGAPAAVTSPFTEGDAAVFQNGLDLVGEPDLLAGPWLESWERDLRTRVRAADIVAVVTIQTVRTDIDLEKRETYRLVARVERAFVGEPPPELVLVVREDEDGYETVDENHTGILADQFLAFVKYAESDEGPIVPRWHLSPATDQVARRVIDALGQREIEEREAAAEREGRTRTIRRPND
ncbi:MAG: hypothetical protein ACFCGT_19225 [Sandaracinaceae bacterium]